MVEVCVDSCILELQKGKWRKKYVNELEKHFGFNDDNKLVFKDDHLKATEISIS